MVSPRRGGRERPKSVGPVRSPASDPPDRSRGQLVLIAGAVIAMLVIGLVVVFNSALYTENIDKGGAGQSGRDATEFATESQRNTRSLSIRVNHARLYTPNSGALKTAFVGNYSSYDALMAEAYVDSASANVDISFDWANSDRGYRYVQHEDAGFEDPGGGAFTWDPVAPATDVGWLVLNLNVSELSTVNDLTVRLDNGSSQMAVSFTKNDSGYVEIRSTFPSRPAQNTVTECWPVRGRLLVDVLGGRVHGRSCSFNASENLAPPYTVTFEGGNHVEGKYEIVTEDQNSGSNWFNSPPGIAHQCTGPGSANPCRTRAIWTANVSVSYSTSRVSYARSWNMEVYNRTHGPY